MNEHKKFGKLLKRLLIVCLCLVMALGSAATIFADGFNGDLNGDGAVTSFDAQMLAEYEAGLRELSWTEELGLTIRGIVDFILGRKTNEPNLDDGIETTFEVKAENGIVTKDKTVSVAGVTATVPAGTKVTGKTLKLSVKKTNSTEGDVALEENQEQLALDIHVDGVAADNTTPIVITVENALDNGYNQGNLELYHVENSVANEMEQVNAAEALNEHNSFYYDPATGDFTVAMATFSVVRAVMNTENAWNGNFNYTWYKDKESPYTIANADQLAAFGAIVGGMDGQTRNSFAGKTVNLVADINLGDKESENNPDLIFYPIGYNSNDGKYEKTGVAVDSSLKTFEGTFDGQGHTISNFYHNTWEMKGDHNWYSPEEQYYRDGMGLFGRVYKGIVKNLTVDNFSSDGEIATTGVIAAYADGATFENIAITNCNPRVYNIGNGGIVGCVGWYAKEADLKTTFTNITVDNSNKISALWGSYDVACGGIVGQYYPTSGQSSAEYPVNGGIDLVNCHVAAQMDVYNDVCGNYQYYAYRYAGMLIGSIRENVTDEETGHVYPDMTGITASGCTVHYDSWNDYYYCEFEKNGHPSYAGENDYKFSRVPESELNFNADGTVTCKHEHSDVEDNRAIYLPFSQLFTGYGWGVTSKGIEDFEGVEVKHVDQKDSVVKFAKADAAKDSYNTGATVTIGELFAAKADASVAIDADNVQVFVSPVGKTSTAGGTYTAAKIKEGEGWTEGTLTFTGAGAATITITDYNFCTPTTINVTIEDRQPVEKFETKFTGDFLYRVGNMNTVTLGSLFKEKNDVTIGNVDVKIETVSSGVSGVYTSKTPWTSGTIQFSGTGVVKVTITDNDYCTPTELYLEVVNAYNRTTASFSGNSVLLNDVSTTGTLSTSGVVYGNGFTVNMENAPISEKNGAVFHLYDGAILKNLNIVGKEFTSVAMNVNDTNYGVSAVRAWGTVVIENCYISGCRSAVSATGNKLTIKDSVIANGIYANIDFIAGILNLHNVTTINEPHAVGNTTVVGLGIVGNMTASAGRQINITGTLTQYNWVSKADCANIKASGMDTIFNEVFENNKYASLRYTYNGITYVNTGILSLCSDFGQSGTTGVPAGYVGMDVEASLGNISGSGYVWAPGQAGALTAEDMKYHDASYVHKSNDQSTSYIPPAFNYTGASLETENDVVQISYENGSSYTLSNATLKVLVAPVKYGQALSYTIKMNGTDYTNQDIVFDATTSQTYTIVYTITDNLVYDGEGKLTDKTYDVTKELKVFATVVDKGADAPTFTFYYGTNGKASAGTPHTTQPTNSYTSTIKQIGEAYYIMPNVSATTANAIGSKTVDGVTVYYPIVDGINVRSGSSADYDFTRYYPIFKAVSISDNGTEYKYSATKEMPDTVTWKNAEIDSGNGASSLNDGFGLYNNQYLCKIQKKAGDAEAGGTSVIQFSYTALDGNTYNYYVGFRFYDEDEGGVCFAGDTLITLADGTQKCADELTFADKILAWDFFTGAYVEKNISLLVNHGEDTYRVANLEFSNGNTLRLIGEHGVFDYDLNKFIYITVDNMQDYVGHRFVQYNTDGSYGIAVLNKAFETVETTCAYSVSSAVTSNVFASGMLTVAPPEDFYNWIEMGDKLQYNVEQFNADVEQYGLYTYDVFKDYVTYEQFVDWNGAYLKIPVEKGCFTFEYILELIELYKQWMPNY